MKHGPEYMLFAGEPAQTYNISIESSYWKLAKQFGDGNASRGIRRVLYQATISAGNETVCKKDSTSVDEL